MAFCVDHLSIACKDGSPLSVDSDEDAADPSGAVESETEQPGRKRVKIDVIYPGAVGVRDDPYYAADLVDGAVRWSRIEPNSDDEAPPKPVQQHRRMFSGSVLWCFKCRAYADKKLKNGIR